MQGLFFKETSLVSEDALKLNNVKKKKKTLA